MDSGISKFTFLAAFFRLVVGVPRETWSRSDNLFGDVNSFHCKISENVQGEYKRQDDNKIPKFIANGIREPVSYQDYFIGPTSVPHWGDCYEKFEQSYLFGLKKVGGATCYRCFTLIQRTLNVLQVVTIDENSCYQSLSSARQSCQDYKLINPGSGIILWRTNRNVGQICPLEGRAQVFYSQQQGLACQYPTLNPSTISNCANGHRMDINFRSCNFPSYNMSLDCLGTWDAGRENGETYFAVYNQYAQEYRCGIYRDLRDTHGYAVAALSNDSSCDRLLRNSSDGYEMFAFYPEPEPNWPSATSQCEFPDWLQGNWGQLVVKSNLITYKNGPNSKQTITAKCVSVHGDRMSIYSRTNCGQSFGYHCLRFKRRSSDVLEFQMSNIILQQNDGRLCEKDQTFANSLWQTAAVIPTKQLSACAYLGHFSTPYELRRPDGDCFNVTVDCTRTSWTKIVSYKCDTGAIFDSHSYHCLGSWREGDYFYSYKTRGLQDDSEKLCFVSKFQGKRLLVKITGTSCDRNVDFSFSSNDGYPTFILDQSDVCRDNVFSTIPLFKTTPAKPTKYPYYPDYDQSNSFRRNFYDSGSEIISINNICMLIALLLLQTL